MNFEQAYAELIHQHRNAEKNRDAPRVAPTTGKKPQSFRNRVRALMADGRERTATDVSHAVGCSPQQAHNALTRLRFDGELASAYVAELTVFKIPR